MTATPTRFFALDSVRATAMLLGVFYHLPIAFMGFGFGASPKTSIDNWLHSYRMPLFFLISGFFANMMLGKYGLKRYLTRRWWRIGAPLVIALLILAGVRIVTNYFQSSSMGPSFGAPAAPFTGFGTAPGGFGATTPPPFGGAGGGVATQPPSPIPGFGPVPRSPAPGRQ